VGLASISRVEEARLEVELCAASKALDRRGAIFDDVASKEALTRWIGNMREMHERVAVGRRMAAHLCHVSHLAWGRGDVGEGAGWRAARSEHWRDERALGAAAAQNRRGGARDGRGDAVVLADADQRLRVVIQLLEPSSCRMHTGVACMIAAVLQAYAQAAPMPK